MPTLKQLKCEIEWGNSGTPFPEYSTTYGDGVVETYIAIPDHPQPFAVRLRSKNYIAEGLAMLVFMDGDYQCNRNRLYLRRPKSGDPAGLDKMTEIDLRVRQKEKPLGNGTYIGRAWRFDKHNIVPLDQLPTNVDRQHFSELGTISVYVLRCRAKEEVECKSATSSEVDDSVLHTSKPNNEGPTREHTSSNTEVQKAEPEAEPDTLLGFMNDGAGDAGRLGLDGEGFGPVEQRAWSWNIPPPPMSAGGVPAGGYVPGQAQPTPAWPYGNYGHPTGLSQSWQPGPAVSQDQPTAPRFQRHVHFNDQIPPLPGGYGASDQQYSGPNLGPNANQSQEREYAQQPGSHGNPPRTDIPQQFSGPGSGQVPDSYTNPSMLHGGVPTAPEHGTGIPKGVDLSYSHRIPNYQPIGYGIPGHPGWPLAVNHPTYAQPAWPAQSTMGPSYVTPPPYLAAPYQLPQPYPYSQPAYPSAPVPLVAPIPPPSSHPGGGIWGPPPPKPGSQDPAKDGENQLDGQSNQNQESTGNAGSRANNSNGQGSATDNNKKPEPDGSSWNRNDIGENQTEEWNNQSTGGDQTHNWNNNNAGGDQTHNWNNNNAGGGQTSDWNNNDSGGGQTNDWNKNGSGGQADNWNNNATQPEAPANNWNHTAAASGQANDAGTSWNGNANTNTQVQHSCNTIPTAVQPHEVAFTYSQPRPGPVTSIQERPLYGPHGPYYGILGTTAECAIQPDAGEEPPYDVPADMPTTHQVKPGEGYVYVHKRRSPEYLDTLDEPYARFVFKYRTKEQIEKEVGIKIEGNEEKRMLQVMDKDEIIDMLLRAKRALGGTVPSPPTITPKANGNARNGVEPSAIPAPAYTFLGYSVPTARMVNHGPDSTANVGLGVSIAAPAPTGTTADVGNAQGWPGKKEWSYNNNNAAPGTTPPQRTISNSSVPPAAAPVLQPQWTQTSAPSAAPAQPQPQPQPQPAQFQPQPQAQPAQQAIPPIQFDAGIQTYKPPPRIVPPPLAPGANGRPVTPPGGWNAQHTARSSSASDNGMAGWDSTAGVAGVSTVGWGAGGTAAAPTQPFGGW